MAQGSSHPINTMVFEGSRHDHVSGFGVTLGLCSGSLSRTFVLRASFVSTWMGHPKHAARSRGSKSWSIGLKSCRDSHRGRMGPRRPGTHMFACISAGPFRGHQAAKHINYPVSSVLCILSSCILAFASILYPVSWHLHPSMLDPANWMLDTAPLDE